MIVTKKLKKVGSLDIRAVQISLAPCISNVTFSRISVTTFSSYLGNFKSLQRGARRD